mmetsp:Transcript_6754/g.10187  ORF Transcript_6754/g.10187 Transcript_6754/m.10187 type:complete len:393 (-) Transcript_6754:462-1640(-)|eukprot:CAMPEP_0113939706 /NCGR_PEP_ID=MMETSP1339-20121228/5978_1 /TAXON_ID=94617 /ORGANISM="Fibrocapsa japonica" /LENGTH=392 /DNA_ID=CAMNT_0000943303 /DNA_START=128 /DNA_END=1306 /DNA_ORIENTATION=- /assembly_acc=CAM_ASM_000762
MEFVHEKKIAFIGAGNLGCAMAAHMALNGYDVSLGNRTASKLDKIKENGNKIKMTGICDAEAQLTVVSHNFEEVIRDRHVIVVCVQADAHKNIANMLVPFIKPDQHVILHPGQTFGAMQVREIFESFDPELASVTVSEITSSLITCRLEEPGHVYASAIKSHVELATLPGIKNQEVVEFFQPLYPQLKPCPTVLITSLNNVNSVVHPMVTMLNAARIDTATPFKYYHEGVSPCVGHMIEKIDLERLKLCKALDIPCKTMAEHMHDFYDLELQRLDLMFNSNPAYDKVFAPKVIATRYFFEDIPTGTMPLASLGRMLHIKTPLHDAMQTMACAMFDTSFHEARTLESLGLSHYSIDQLKEYLHTGVKPGLKTSQCPVLRRQMSGPEEEMDGHL